MNPDTLITNRPGVFAAGDVVRGPNTVIEAIADGKKSATMIDRYIRGEALEQKEDPILPQYYVAPLMTADESVLPLNRVELQRAPAEWRKRNFAEVEVSLSIEEATCEARRCLRCDLEFTQPKEDEKEKVNNLKTSTGVNVK